MSQLSTLGSEKPKISDFDQNHRKDNIAIPIALSSDSLYIKLIDHFQAAKFTECYELLEILETRYAGHPLLKKFREDLQLKLSLQNLAISDLKNKKAKKIKVSFRMGLFAVLSTLVILVVFFISYSYLNKIRIARNLEDQAAQLVLLQEQAEQLLIAGKPQDASEIVEKMRLINPEYINLPELTTNTIDLLLLETKYNAAIELVEQDRLIEAVLYFREINNARPGLWDVSQQIASLTNPDRIAAFLEEGNNAFQVEMWDQVINAYETALVLDPGLNDTAMISQLPVSYLKKIPGILQKEFISVDEVNIAYDYYIKALELIPNYEELSNEIRTLIDSNGFLISQMFAQFAKSNFEDTAQTESTIAEAVSFLEKAIDTNPNEIDLQLELRNAEYYQSAFKNIVEMNWELALSNLNLIYTVDPNYAEGNVQYLLYEAYYAQGENYYSEGLYESAFSYLKQAEILSLNDSENLMKYFQTQVLLGDIVEKLGNFEAAVGYYKNAIIGIQISDRLAGYPEIMVSLNDAYSLTDQGDFGKAFVAFQDILSRIDLLFLTPEVGIQDKGCLVFFANENSSTVSAIRIANELPDAMVITFKRNLIVPRFEK